MTQDEKPVIHKRKGKKKVESLQFFSEKFFFSGFFFVKIFEERGVKMCNFAIGKNGFVKIKKQCNEEILFKYFKHKSKPTSNNIHVLFLRY